MNVVLEWLLLKIRRFFCFFIEVVFGSWLGVCFIFLFFSCDLWLWRFVVILFEFCLWLKFCWFEFLFWIWFEFCILLGDDLFWLFEIGILFDNRDLWREFFINICWVFIGLILMIFFFLLLLCLRRWRGFLLFNFFFKLLDILVLKLFFVVRFLVWFKILFLYIFFCWRMDFVLLYIMWCFDEFINLNCFFSFFFNLIWGCNMWCCRCLIFWLGEWLLNFWEDFVVLEYFLEFDLDFIGFLCLFFESFFELIVFIFFFRNEDIFWGEFILFCCFKLVIGLKLFDLCNILLDLEIGILVEDKFFGVL